MHRQTTRNFGWSGQPNMIAGDARQATSVLANFRQLADDRPIKIAPLVGRLIEPDVLAKLRWVS
jgi:hypothetical protein